MGQQMVKQISVDLDHRSIVQLLRVYFSSKKLLPGVPMEVFISSSGIGFHLKFYKSVTVEEDLKIAPFYGMMQTVSFMLLRNGL